MEKEYVNLYVSDFNLPQCNNILWIGNECEYFQGIEYCKQQKIKYSILKNIWDSKNKVKSARIYVHELIEDIIAEMTPKLNRLHKVRFDSADWFFLLHHWMLFYISAMYDKYCRLLETNNMCEKYNVIVLETKQTWTLTHTWEMCDEICREPYNLYQYSLLLKNFKFDNITVSFESNNKYDKYVLEQMSKNLADLPSDDWHKKIRKMCSARVIVYQSDVSDILSKLEWLSFGRVLDFSFWAENLRMELDNLTPVFDENIRKTINIKLKNKYFSDVFAQFIAKQIVNDIPYVFVEGWKKLREIEYKYFFKQRNVKLIITKSYYTDIFRLYIVLMRKRGAVLGETQHGGNYGITVDALGGNIYKNSDIFYTWGWKYNNSDKCRYIPMPAVKLLNLKKYIKKNSGKFILYANSFSSGKAASFYCVRDFMLLEHELEERRFFEKLARHIRSDVVFRPYSNMYDRGKQYIDFYKNKYPEMTFENKTYFYEILGKCRLMITNKISTTFLEALAMNKPCIIFCSDDFYELEPEAESWILKLKRAGILHNSAESAADFVNKHYAQIEQWWNEPKRQKIVHAFTHKYALQEKSGKWKWILEVCRWCK